PFRRALAALRSLVEQLVLASANRTGMAAPALPNSSRPASHQADPRPFETPQRAREGSRIRVRLRIITNGATLLAEVLLVLVGAAEVRAEPNGMPARLAPQPTRDTRQLDFRQLIVR